ncbi:pseudaminic acid biosynthesis-associated methylase [Paenibacillus psychroresistens]|uniref:Pseudaminic acid biosynthesis-associated methylase n=1 Tax=Paenibacillus psychroresistens TaxID=1778678 RepID=A0A6B8RBJ6_9BACL|nr:pseudaminic acid biosynthesis-associated methylase [Paenibacillus psychroresistens]QGQ93527.1 pseudaminic acid biosynthesis-associated methylase [Paenibacillus psychroresistens]
MKTYKTEQEEFWASEFGDAYIDRNKDQNLFRSNVALFSKIIARTTGVNSIIECGANIGMNLKALQHIIPRAEFAGIEINQKAVEQLRQIEGVEVYHESLLNFVPTVQYDLTLIKTVLIHINPDELSKIYDLLYSTSNKYICIIEYYNPSPVEVTYRGHEGKLFKRDFAGELMDRFSELQLVDYGFVYKRDPNFAQDDVTWFLMEKR